VAGEQQPAEQQVTYLVSPVDAQQDLAVGGTIRLSYYRKHDARDDDSDLDEPAEIWIADHPIESITSDPMKPGSQVVHLGTGKWVSTPKK
jgi:hypothetical protein